MKYRHNFIPVFMEQKLAAVMRQNVSVAAECCNDLLADGGGHKEKTYFWQYNTQSKGPKGKRLCRVVNDDDPYVLHDFEDPVFDSELLVNIHLLGAHIHCVYHYIE